MQRDPYPVQSPKRILNRVGLGRHFLHIPGPTNVPDRVLRAIDFPTIDHRGPEFQRLALDLLKGIRGIFQTKNPVVVYASSGTGAWEAALVNTLNPGDKVLIYEAGHFAALWVRLARRMGLIPECIEGDWRIGVDPQRIYDALSLDKDQSIKAVCVVHNETSTGVTANIPAVRAAIDAAKHPALFMVDTVSSLGAIDYRHDEWGVDVTVAGSQKGLMLPPGLGFNAVSEKALIASKKASMPRAYWAWDDIISANEQGFWPSTPATNLLFGLAEAIDMLSEVGLDNVFQRHIRHGRATRAAVEAWGLEVFCKNEDALSPASTTILMPEKSDGSRFDADAFRRLALERFNISLGSGLSKLAGKVFRIGHLGDLNDLSLLGALGGVEMALRLTGISILNYGVPVAMEVLQKES